VVSVRDLGDFIRDQRRAAQISLRELARQAGVSNPYLSQIERGLRHPSAEILQQIAKALRISAEALYVQAGILEERHGDTEVTAAILGDEGLTERQKQVVLEIYEAFRRENFVPPAAEEVAGPPGDEVAGIPDEQAGSSNGLVVEPESPAPAAPAPSAPRRRSTRPRRSAGPAESSDATAASTTGGRGGGGGRAKAPGGSAGTAPVEAISRAADATPAPHTHQPA